MRLLLDRERRASAEFCVEPKWSLICLTGVSPAPRRQGIVVAADGTRAAANMQRLRIGCIRLPNQQVDLPVCM
jgi:hypothetical protein